MSAWIGIIQAQDKEQGKLNRVQVWVHIERIGYEVTNSPMRILRHGEMQWPSMYGEWKLRKMGIQNSDQVMRNRTLNFWLQNRRRDAKSLSQFSPCAATAWALLSRGEANSSAKVGFWMVAGWAFGCDVCWRLFQRPAFRCGTIDYQFCARGRP